MTVKEVIEKEKIKIERTLIGETLNNVEIYYGMNCEIFNDYEEAITMYGNIKVKNYSREQTVLIIHI